jgi:hypothetical protein
VQTADSIVVNGRAWQETYQRSFDEAFRELVALGVTPDEAIDALRDAFIRGRDDGEDECTTAWLIAAASGIWRRRRWRARVLAPLARHFEVLARLQRPSRALVAPRRCGERIGAAIAATGLAVPLLVVAVMVAGPMSAVVEQPNAPMPITPAAPTARPVSDPLSEADVWAETWSLSRGVPVLRPDWLPGLVAPVRIFHYRVPTPVGYRVEYHGMGTGVGEIVPQVHFLAGPAEYVERSLVDFGLNAGESVTVRGRPGRLQGSGRPYWQVLWSERGYRYAIQAFAFSREDVLLIAESLAPVIDDSGRTRADNLVPFVTPERW